MCSGFLAWGALLVLMSLCRAGVRQVKQRRQSVSQEERQRLELRRRRRVGNRRGRTRGAKGGDVAMLPANGGGALLASSGARADIVKSKWMPTQAAAPAGISGIVGVDSTASWHANPMRSNTPPVVGATADSRAATLPPTIYAGHGALPVRGVRGRRSTRHHGGRGSRLARPSGRTTGPRAGVAPAAAGPSAAMLSQLRALRRQNHETGSS